jgi:hypothetical protein
MPFSAYGRGALRVLSAALAEVIATARKSAGAPLSETETSSFSERITTNLMRAYDRGKRGPEALQLAALRASSGRGPKTKMAAGAMYSL